MPPNGAWEPRRRRASSSRAVNRCASSMDIWDVTKGYRGVAELDPCRPRLACARCPPLSHLVDDEGGGAAPALRALTQPGPRRHGVYATLRPAHPGKGVDGGAAQRAGCQARAGRDKGRGGGQDRHDGRQQPRLARPGATWSEAGVGGFGSLLTASGAYPGQDAPGQPLLSPQARMPTLPTWLLRTLWQNSFTPRDATAPPHVHAPVKNTFFPARTRATARCCSGDRSVTPWQGREATLLRDPDDTAELAGLDPEAAGLGFTWPPPKKQVEASDGAGRGSLTVTFRSRAASGRRGGCALVFDPVGTGTSPEALTGPPPRQACSRSRRPHSAAASAEVSVSWTQRGTDRHASVFTARKRMPSRPWAALPPYRTSGALQGRARGRGLVCSTRVCRPQASRQSSTIVSLGGWAATKEPEASPCSTFTCVPAEGGCRGLVGGCPFSVSWPSRSGTQADTQPCNAIHVYIIFECIVAKVVICMPPRADSV